MTFETEYAYSEYQNEKKEYFDEHNEPYEMVKKGKFIKQMDELIELMNKEIQKLEALQKGNRVESLVIQQNTKIFKMQLHQTIDLQDKEGFAIYGYLPYRYITRVPGGWIYSNYDTEKDMYVVGDKIFVPFVREPQE